MSGSGNKKLSRKNDENRRWHIGVYGRRSFDDGENSESYTIKNQKALIESFLENKANIEIEDYYIDDGYTGTNFERPDFKRMLQDVVNGKINGIIVKDLSRLGRNYIEVGNFIDEIVPQYGLRFISINDKVDSYLELNVMDSLEIPFKNLMNESYSKGSSKKMRSSLKASKKSGNFIGKIAPFGYLKDPEDVHKLIVDKDAAIIIKNI